MRLDRSGSEIVDFGGLGGPCELEATFKRWGPRLLEWVSSPPFPHKLPKSTVSDPDLEGTR